MITEPMLYGRPARPEGCGRTAVANTVLSFWQSRIAPRHHDLQLADIPALAREIRRTPCKRG